MEGDGGETNQPVMSPQPLAPAILPQGMGPPANDVKELWEAAAGPRSARC